MGYYYESKRRKMKLTFTDYSIRLFRLQKTILTTIVGQPFNIYLLFNNMTHMMHSCPVCNGCATDATVDDDDDDDDAETSSRTCPTVERSGPCQSCRTLIIS